MDIFVIVYWATIVGQIVVRAPVDRKRRQGKISERRPSLQEQILVWTLTLGGFVLPLIYSLTPWLRFADYSLPAWSRWIGVILAGASLFVFWRSHADLGVFWSPTLEIREEHELVTRGIYGLIRHPMYASQFLLCFGQILLIPNILGGAANLLLFALFYALRVGPEEKMMLDIFGEQYRAYRNRTGGVIPKLSQ